MLLYFVFTVIGILIGLNIGQSEHPKESYDDLQKEINKLKSELTVYKNLKDSLLDDLKYWRDKASKNVIQK